MNHEPHLNDVSQAEDLRERDAANNVSEEFLLIFVTILGEKVTNAHFGFFLL